MTMLSNDTFGRICAALKPAPPFQTDKRCSIPLGMTCVMDHHFFRWPIKNYAGYEDVPADLLFDVQFGNGHFVLRAPGFGGEPYGNGAITITYATWLRPRLQSGKDI
jgi:hypothetical protein